MGYKDSILRLLDLIEQEEAFIAGNIDAIEREKPGDLAYWAPKEVICHNADWTQRQVNNIRLARSGGKPVKYDNYLELNDQDFQENCKLTWSQSIEKSRAARAALRDLLRELDEKDLLRDDLIPGDNLRPLWQRMIGTSVEHVVIHLGTVANDLGQLEGSTRFQETIAAELMRLAPENQEYQGNIRYNLACHHALTMQKEKAIAGLREALALNPALLEWSKKDSDLDSLREEADFQALYE